MTQNQVLTAELQHEAQATRRLLERVPTDKLGWKPHEKSMTLGQLAKHVAEIPGYYDFTINREYLDFAEGDYKPEALESTEQLLKIADENLASGVKALENASDEHLGKNWQLKNDGQVLMDMPRIQAARGMIMNHLYHHRGQLTVYLRLLDVPLPSVYGPTADEPVF